MLSHECSTTFGGGGRGMTCSPDDHVMIPWSPHGDYLLSPLFGNLLFWMTPPPPPVLVFYCLWSCIPTTLLITKGVFKGGFRGFKPPPLKFSDFFLKSEGKEIERKRKKRDVGGGGYLLTYFWG